MEGRNGIKMNQLKTLKTEISEFGTRNEEEMKFLFRSLKHSLGTAANHASLHRYDRTVPSIKHAINLSGLLYKNLCLLPVPSLQGHIDDLFDYMKETLEENLRVPLAEDLAELGLLIKELEKGMATLLVPMDSIRLPEVEKNPEASTTVSQAQIS